MAFIGMRHVVAAKVATETPGQALTYDAGMVVGKAIQGNLTWNRNDNPLYADDAIAENDNGVTGGSIELGTDDLLDAVRAYLLGDEVVTVGSGTSKTTEYETTDEPAPYVGFGYVRVRIKNGRIMGVQSDASGTIRFRRRATFEALAAAVAWLDDKAGI